MIIKATREELEKALAMVNERYDNNVTWNDFERLNGSGTRFRITLRVKDSHGKGGKLGHENPRNGRQRHTINACWHVHGHFFEALLEINEDIVIKTAGRTVDKNGGNWHDWNIGSLMYPRYFSEACECGAY